MLIRWWRSRHAHSSYRPRETQRTRASQRLTFRPFAEPLEDRTLLSAGNLDPTFGGAGTVVTSFPSAVAAGNAVAIQSDGKIVVAGSATVGGVSEFAVTR